MDKSVSNDEMWDLIREHRESAIRLGFTRDGEDESLKDERLAAALELSRIETKLHRIIFKESA